MDEMNYLECNSEFKGEHCFENCRRAGRDCDGTPEAQIHQEANERIDKLNKMADKVIADLKSYQSKKKVNFESYLKGKRQGIRIGKNESLMHILKKIDFGGMTINDLREYLVDDIEARKLDIADHEATLL